MKMKKTIALILALVMVFALTACGGNASSNAPSTPNTNANANTGTAENNAPAEKPAASDPEVTLTVALFNNAGNPHEPVLNYIFAETYNRSGGTVKFDYYPGGTICGQADMLDGILNGVADIGYLQTADNGSAMPELSVLDYPGIYFASAPAISNAVHEYIETYKPAELDGLKFLCASYGTKGCICSNASPIHTPDDLVGTTIRATGNNGKCITNLGGTPADVSMADCYEAIRTGVVDGIMTIRGAIYTFNLDEVLDYGMDYPLYNNGGLFVMNESAWEKLTPNQQAALQSAVDDAWEICWNKFFNDFYKEPAAKRLKENLEEYYYPTDEEIALFTSKVEHIAKEYCGTIDNGDEIFQRWSDLAEKWNAVYPAKSDDDPDMYIALDPNTGERLQCGSGVTFEFNLPY